jgi:hypothetical protein
VTAATAPPVAGQSGGPLSQGVREASQDGPPEGRSATVSRQVPAVGHQASATANQSGRTVVPAPRPECPGAVISDGSATTSRDTLVPLSPQASAANWSGLRTSSDQGAPASATAGQAGTKPVGRPSAAGPAEAGRGTLPNHGEPVSAALVQGVPECAIFAYVDALDGAERKVLLNHIAQAWPDVVEAGVELVAQWRAEGAEQRRKKGRRHEHDRLRRRAEERGSG